MVPAPAVERLAGQALVVLLHLAAALGHMSRGETVAALDTLTRLAEFAPAASAAPYAAEALYWRARLGEAQGERDALVSAGKDYMELLGVLPDGRRRREVQVRLAALSGQGSVLDPEEARLASRRNLELIGLALHAYAADNGGALPGEIFDLVGGYVTDPAVLVRPGRVDDVFRMTRPGRRGAGGSRIYEYTPGLRAGALRPSGAAGEDGWKVPAVVREPAAAPDGTRLVLGLDGAVRSVQEGVAVGGEDGGEKSR